MPSVASLVVGAPLTDSWLAHPRCHAIYQALGEMADWPGVVEARLVDGNVTFVHPRLADAVRVVARSGEPWQRHGLDDEARRLLARIERRGSVRTDEEHDTDRRRALARAATGLERRLLVRAEEVHSERGHHARVLSSWEDVASDLSPAEARTLLEQALAALNEDVIVPARLPWHARPARASVTRGR